MKTATNLLARAWPALLLSVLTMTACKAVAPGSREDPAGGSVAPPSVTTTPSEEEGALALVNGVPITDADVDQALRSKAKGHSPELDPKARASVVETLIRQELVYQRAKSLGLDKNERYQAELRRLEAAARAFRRQGVQEAFYRHEMETRVKVTDEEARAFFDENTDRLATEVHILQILARTEDDITEAERKLKAGEAFEDVVAARFRTIPPSGPKPWDLGFIRWKQMPEPWRDVVFELEPGSVSGILRGTNSRFWILKVLDKRKVPDATFEALKPMIMADLEASKLREARSAIDRELRDAATIIRTGVAREP